MLPRPEVQRLIRKGVIDAYRREVERYISSGLKLKDGRELEADLVILATGWKTDYEFLGTAANDKLGLEYDGLYLCSTVVVRQVRYEACQTRMTPAVNELHPLHFLEAEAPGSGREI